MQKGTIHTSEDNYRVKKKGLICLSRSKYCCCSIQVMEVCFYDSRFRGIIKGVEKGKGKCIKKTIMEMENGKCIVYIDVFGWNK